jgi:kumamolisin
MTQIPSKYCRLTDSELKPPPDARLVSPAEPDEAVTVRVCLRTRPDGRPLPGHEHWLATPPGQRNFPSLEEFAARHGAAPQDLAAIGAFARTFGLEVVQTSVAGRTVVLSGTAAQVNQAFAVELGRYESSRGTYRSHDGFIHLPEEIADVVVAVFGLDNRPVGGHNTPGDPPGFAPFLAGPPQVAQLYNFPAPPPGITAQTIGIIEFGGGWQQADINFTLAGNSSLNPPLSQYIPGWKAYLPAGAPALIPPTPTDVNVTGSNTPGNSYPDGEVILDICAASSVAPGAKIRIYWGSDEQSVSDWQAVLNAIIDDTERPSVVTTSIYLSNGDDSPTLQRLDGTTQSQIKTLSRQFQSLAALGVTVLAASGDDGARSLTTDGLRHVQYPGSDPWVTSCGGTSISPTIEPAPWIFPDYVEWVWNDIYNDPALGPTPKATGGGVSACFPLPAWQQPVAVPVSLNDNTTVGRGVPDVAGNASLNTGYPAVVDGNQTGPLAGTSAVAPLYAGLMAIINANLSEPVGFLNPTLYAFRETVCLKINVQDIPPQDNSVSAWVNQATDTSYPAVTGYPSGWGWDACTGLGTIDGSRLLGALQTVYQKHCWISPQYPNGLGENQVKATLNGNTPGVVSNAFFVVVEGFTPDGLGISAGDLSSTPSVAPALTCSRAGMTITATGLLAEDPSLPENHPQQFTWVCAAEFDTSLSAFTGVTGLSPVWVALTASIQDVSGYTWTPLVLRKGGPVVTG